MTKHLLFDERTQAVLGECVEESGSVRSIHLFSKNEQEKLRGVLQGYKQQGIPSLRRTREALPASRSTIFAIEFIPFASCEAFMCLAERLTPQGYFFYRVDPAYATYWEQIRSWPLTNRMKGKLFSIVRQVPAAKLALWDREWDLLVMQMRSYTS